MIQYNLIWLLITPLAFSSSFASISWIKKKNILPGLCLSNEYMSRDESLHVAHAVLLYGKLQNKLSDKDFIEIIKEAVDIEIEFITLAIPCRMIGMNSTLMISYIKFVADRLYLLLGYDKIYGDKNPLDFIESISLDLKTNLFDARISDYGLADKIKTDDVFDC